MAILHRMSQRHRSDIMSPVLVGLLGVLAGAMIVAICHCVIVCCSESQRRRRLGARSSASVGGRDHDARSGEVEHQTVQVIVQSKEYREDLCAVCLGEFRVGERVRVLTECAHIFHVPCINKWLENHWSCPLCRTSTVPPSRVNVPTSSGSDGISIAEMNRRPESDGYIV